jgi:adenylate kinase
VNVILLGPPGVGKGTQGELLMEALGWERIATGDLLRAARREGTELGQKAQEYMDAGELVPDDLIVALVEERLEDLSSDTGVLFDGFPRTVPQAEALSEVLPRVGRELSGVVVFECPDEVLQKRISGRRHSPDSGRVYNVYFDPPETEGICDEAGTPLVHRKDDRPETVARRLEVYKEQTAPLIRHYEKSSTPVLRIDGDQSMDQVQTALRNALDQKLGVEGSGA